MLLAGMPTLRPGEDVLLFLGREGSGRVRMPVGLAQGKFSVVADSEGGKMLVRDASGMTLVRRDGSRILGEGRTVLDYAEVVAHIEAALATRRGR